MLLLLTLFRRYAAAGFRARAAAIFAFSCCMPRLLRYADYTAPPFHAVIMPRAAYAMLLIRHDARLFCHTAFMLLPRYCRLIAG